MRKKILIVEDYLNIVEILTMRLEALGYDVICAHDGAEGLKMARELTPDLIILDTLLPKMDGFKVSRLLKFDSKFKDIPIIMLTSRESRRHEALGLEIGADEYVYKSDQKGTLLKLVDKYLKSSAELNHG
ncbi:MAG: PleD family two-component system response regulator [bacterium]